MQSPLALRGHNPDVLTCIANLSNDEVFTPPTLANQMLDALADTWAKAHDGASIWRDSSVRFLDPFTKSGIFLREIVRRLTDGLEDEIPDIQERVDHILTKQVFGIAITELTGMLTRRSVYCSKYANGPHSIAKSFTTSDGNIWFERTEHTWDGGKCRYCGANEKDYERGDNLETYAYVFIHNDDIGDRIVDLFGGNMRFDVIIGNPPYQLGQSGGESIGGFAMPVYQKFVQAAKSLDPMYVVMVTPSRWFAGGRGLDDYRAEMLNDCRLRTLVDFPDASDAFPGTQIKGGVSYFVWDRSWDGPCEVSTVASDGSIGPTMRRNLNMYDVLVRRNEAIPILEKVLARNEHDGLSHLGSRVSPIQPFGLRTNFRGGQSAAALKDAVQILGNGGSTFIERSDVPRNHDWIDQWKVLLGAAYGAGDSFPHQIYNLPVIAAPGTACTETFLVIDRFDSEVKAQRFASYLRTRFVRFLVSLRKYTQHLYNDRFSFVPALPMDRSWSDAELYQRYDITDEEIDFIESMVRAMEPTNE